MKKYDLDSVLLVETVRGNVVECRHRGSVVIVNLEGQVIDALGNPFVITPMRSTAKPFQIIPLLEHSRSGELNLTSEEISIIAGSHNGEKVHQSVVQGLMEKGELSINNLLCGVHPPYQFSVAEQTMFTDHQKISPLQHNCSGKNIGMLLLSKIMECSIEDYQNPNHPVQKLILSILCELWNINEKLITVLIDGCGVPTYGVELAKIAYLYALFGLMVKNGKHGIAIKKVRDSMMRHPFLVAGNNRLETDLMMNSPVIAKIGADGLYCVSLPSKGWGIAVKIESGSSDASESVVVELLNKKGILSEDALSLLDFYRYRKIMTSNGRVAGQYRPVF